MKQSESNQQTEGDAAQRTFGGKEPMGAEQQFEPQELNQAELAVMHPDGDDPEWRYYFGAWHS